MKQAIRLRYQAEADPSFARQIMSVPGCEGLHDCIQCGTCSGVCPLGVYMDYSPRQIIALTREGFRDTVLRSRTLWLCASCYACTTECPRHIRITDILYELKQRALKQGIHARSLPTPVLAREFASMVARDGRITESLLVVLLYLKTNWIAAMKSWRLGLGLLARGRFPLRLERIPGRHQLRAALRPADPHAEPPPAPGVSGNGGGSLPSALAPANGTSTHGNPNSIPSHTP